ncbi:hypothetical protein [Thermospira aquatica]|uniref:ApeA N-terminal domain-containing protein n=1 Tax=Thermospira aquatica TaxID=2828656 RepID=A0AAX3BAG8_9SPIR|nr:hypothetical protein [Thermospira aquatica]URA09246.1 hypothetical protein KDW03_06985 [Thermospira aquatica]
MKNRDLTFSDWLKEDFEKLGEKEWVPVFWNFGSLESGERVMYSSAIIVKNKVKEALKKVEPDLYVYEEKPDFVEYRNKKGKRVLKYRRFHEEGIEPLVYWRIFKGKKRRKTFIYLEEDKGKKEKVFLFIDERTGKEDEVIYIEKDKVLIKLKYLKEYLAIKQAYLALYFELVRLSEHTLEELGKEEIRGKITRDSNYIYSFSLVEDSINGFSSLGRLRGKKIIAPPKDFHSVFEKGSQKFEEFIIEVGKEGKEIWQSCEFSLESEFAELFVFFRREVLKKYYDKHSSFTVEDGKVEHKGFWHLPVMNNHREYVVVRFKFLHGLPYEEQVHWRNFNVTPKGVSDIDLWRYLNGVYLEPEHPEFLFKKRFFSFQAVWREKFGWDLFLPLPEGDSYHMKTLHVPFTSDQKEFDEQILSLHKILIESLNDKELAKGVSIEKQNPGSIDKLEAFLKHHNFPDLSIIEFLKKLQALRSAAVAHRKGKKYEEIKEYFGIGTKSFFSVFEDILNRCIEILTKLNYVF